MDQAGDDLDKLWDAQIDGAGAINDCDGGSDGIHDCSAWAFLKQGLVPMVYNYPELQDSAGAPLAPKQHMVGLMAKLTPEIEAQITRMHVVDGDTWKRFLGGLHPDDYLTQHLGELCPGWGAKDVTKLQFACVPRDPRAEWCNAATGRIEAPIGVDGGYWSDHFMYKDFPQGDKPALSEENTMNRQCEFWRDSSGKWDWDFFFGAMKSFYNKAVYQQRQGQVKPLPDKGLYLENELNIEGLKAKAAMEMVKGGMLAVVVQTNTCEEQLVSLGAAAAKVKCDGYYTQPQPPLPTSPAFPTPESYMIDESKRAACRLAEDLTKATGRWIPAVEAKFTTNSVVDVENWEW